MRIYLKVPNNEFLQDQRYSRADASSDEPDWIFIEPAVEEDDEGNQLWPIHSRTTVTELMDCFEDTEFPPNASIIIERG